MSPLKIYLIVPLIALISCNLKSGTWEDDDKNWQRAFNSTLSQTDSINVIHSLYWRSPHFSFEHGFFFQLEYTPKLEELYISSEDLVKIDTNQYNNIHFFGEKPIWFVPDDYGNYDIWTSVVYPNFFLFIDKKKETISFAECQT